MDLAKTLVRSVVRAFYETKHILIIDALVIHSALRDDDLAYLISMNIKDLHKIHSRSELREGQQRPNNRTYYYVDYRQTIDAIKWRVYKIDKDLQGPVVPPSEKKEYFCDRCGAEWTQMEVLDNVGPAGFLCHRCSSVLRHGDGGQSGGHERSTRMNNQFKFITDLLPKIDSVVVPDNDFETAFNGRRPVMRDSTHQTHSSVGVDAMNRPTAVKGMANTGPSTLSVSIQAGSGPSEEEKAEERAQRERVAQQNALPSWMSNSTITGEAFKTDLAAGVQTFDDDVKDPTIKAKTDANAEADIDDYFSRLKKEQAAEAAKKNSNNEDDEDEDDEEDDDDEEEFEDVVQTENNSGAATPAGGGGGGGGGLAPPRVSPPRSAPFGAGNGSTLPKAPSPLRQAHSQSSLKREAMSDPPTPTASPKKIKLEDGASDAAKPAVKAEAEESDEDDDDIEFEDV
ncbi:hypothetical protein SCUCBS95973_000034 [Sporothrix curviconia]|uniref:HTH TFE/IIEalpha-type domain-containing protein n=1 Tax=Sporothrix curviconia TaxID=1260050 RepID=A0ABP0ALX7_9PEZI